MLAGLSHAHDHLSTPREQLQPPLAALSRCEPPLNASAGRWLENTHPDYIDHPAYDKIAAAHAAQLHDLFVWHIKNMWATWTQLLPLVQLPLMAPLPRSLPGTAMYGSNFYR